MMQDLEDEESVISLVPIKSEVPQKRRRIPKKIIIPRRSPSVVIPAREIVYVTPDKTVCAECTCFPKEEPYEKPKKLNQCQMSPITLANLAAAVLNKLPYPTSFDWSEEKVAEWMETVVGLPQYKDCILDNHINGRRLLRLEEPSVLPEMNIHNFDHIKMITAAVRKLFSTEFIHYMRSLGLPNRNPLTYCTWFKSLTGPSWGIRNNWKRTDLFLWMKIIMPDPIYLDHWDLVWYEKPEYPKVLFAQIPKATRRKIPHWHPPLEFCNEYTTPRKFRLWHNLPEEAQLIWLEHRPGSPSWKPPVQMKTKPKKAKAKESRLIPKKIDLTGLAGKDLILARRKSPKPKFLK